MSKKKREHVTFDRMTTPRARLSRRSLAGALPPWRGGRGAARPAGLGAPPLAPKPPKPEDDQP